MTGRPEVGLRTVFGVRRQAGLPLVPLLGLCALLACAPPAAHGDAAGPGPGPATGAPAEIEFETAFREMADGERLVGAAFAVVSAERVLRIGTYGHTDTTRSRPIDPDTAFRIASVSKTFAAGLAALLVDDGHIRWEDPVTNYVPDFRIRGDASLIRVADLLGQSSGLIPHAYDNLIEDGVPVEQIRSRLAELEPNCAPGSCYSYQNTVFSLFEPVVEQAAAESYGRLIEQRIFRPLGMDTASVGYEAFLATDNRAAPHVKRGGRWQTVPVAPNYYRVAPAAGVNASIRDMAKWLMAQLGAYPQVLRPDEVNFLIAPRVRTPGELRRKEWSRILTDAHYGLGWRVYQIGTERIAYHSGWVSGYRADVAWSPGRGVGIAVLMNAEDSIISAMTTHFWEAVFASPPEPNGGSASR